MMENPEAFVHLSVRDQWRLAFGEKMHGRETEKKLLTEVASRVSGTKSNDALFEALALVMPQKNQVTMITGKSGAGKSRLVMETRKNLENRGEIFFCAH
jgi:ATP-dependent RNA helicase DDX31/DBP7